MNKTYKIKINENRMESFKKMCKDNNLKYTDIIENMMNIFILDTDMMIKANERWNNHFKNSVNP